MMSLSFTRLVLFVFLHSCIDAIDIQCGSIDFIAIQDTCVSTTQHVTLVGNCTNGIWEEQVDLYDCRPGSPYCHECGSTRIICSDESNSLDACGEFPFAFPSGFTAADCNSVGTGYMREDQCTSPTNFSWEYAECQDGTSVAIESQAGVCSDYGPALANCMDCDGAVGFCHGGDPDTTTCESLGVGSALETFSATCNPAIDSTFFQEYCISATQYAVRQGDCVNGRMETAGPYVVDCIDGTFCHNCGSTRVVCSQSSDLAEACNAFPSTVPSGATCSQIGTGELTQQVCTSPTTFASETLVCATGETLQQFFLEAPCNYNNSALDHCLDCGTIINCHGGDVSTTCESLLGLSDPPPPTASPGSPTPPPDSGSTKTTRLLWEVVAVVFMSTAMHDWTFD